MQGHRTIEYWWSDSLTGEICTEKSSIGHYHSEFDFPKTLGLESHSEDIP
jgi:hypothetical protein